MGFKEGVKATLSGPFYARFWRRVGDHGDNPITLQGKNKAHQDLWSPTQTKTRLEWATQPYSFPGQ